MGKTYEGVEISRGAEVEAYLLPHWYAAHSCANHEKRVADQLANRGIENFLPQYESLRKWKDRRMKLKLPLFPGYVFVRTALRDSLPVLQIPGVVRLVGFGGRPMAVPEAEVARIRDFLNKGFQAEPYPFLSVGSRIRIKSGPLAGLEGVLTRHKGRQRVVLSIEMIQRSMVVDADASDLEPLARAASTFCLASEQERRATSYLDFNRVRLSHSRIQNNQS
jgi:transcription antitermination factor NusG